MDGFTCIFCGSSKLLEQSSIPLYPHFIPPPEILKQTFARLREPLRERWAPSHYSGRFELYSNALFWGEDIAGTMVNKLISLRNSSGGSIQNKHWHKRTGKLMLVGLDLCHCFPGWKVLITSCYYAAPSFRDLSVLIWLLWTTSKQTSVKRYLGPHCQKDGVSSPANDTGNIKLKFRVMAMLGLWRLEAENSPLKLMYEESKAIEESEIRITFFSNER